MNRGARALSALTLILLTSAFLSSAALGEDCASCHIGPSPDGNYRFAKPTLSFTAPSIVQPNATLYALLNIQHPGTYEVRDFKAELDLSKANGMLLRTGEVADKSLPNMDSRPQSHGLTWQIATGNATGACTIKVSVSYNVHYPHNTGGSKDNAFYSANFVQTTAVAVTPFEVSPSTIQATVGRTTSITINLTATQEIYNVELVPGLSIKNFTTVSPSKVGTLAKNQRKALTVALTPDRALEQGSISIIWSTDKAGANRSSMSIGVKTIVEQHGGGKGGGQGSLLRWTGRILGFVDLALLMMLMPTGGVFKQLRKPLNKAMGGAKRRVDLHCAMSYLLMAMTLLHATVLMYGHYKGVMWNGVFLIATADYLSINLGSISLVLMGVISLLGILQKKLCKAIGRKAWGWTHGIISYAALAVIVVHLLWIGSTAAPIRALILP